MAINKGSFCLGLRNLNILGVAEAQSNITLYIRFNLVLLKEVSEIGKVTGYL